MIVVYFFGPPCIVDLAMLLHLINSRFIIIIIIIIIIKRLSRREKLGRDSATPFKAADEPAPRAAASQRQRERFSQRRSQPPPAPIV